MVDSNQQQQLEELQEIAHSTFKGSLPGLEESAGFDNNAEQVFKSYSPVEDESKEKADLEKSS